MGVNAIDLLVKDHDTVKALLEELTETTPRAEKKRAELLQKIEDEIRVHTQLEEEIFYPAFRDAGKREEATMYFEAMEEHRAVEALILPDLKKTDVSTDQFSGRAKVLKEMIEHHANEEEEDMFPKAKELLSQEELEALGERMLKLKSSLER